MKQKQKALYIAVLSIIKLKIIQGNKKEALEIIDKIIKTLQ